MEILVKGSFKPNPNATDSGYSEKKARFATACRELGTALARKNHTILVGIPKWGDLQDGSVVASYVIDGANKAPLAKDGKPHEVIFYAPLEREPDDLTDIPDTLSEFKKMTNIHLVEDTLGKGAWASAMIKDVYICDAIILIGGGEGTAGLGYAARSMDKVVVALPAFGGAAADIHEGVLCPEYEEYQQ